MAAGVDTAGGTAIRPAPGSGVAAPMDVDAAMVHPVLAALAGVRVALTGTALTGTALTGTSVADRVWSLSDAEVVAGLGEVLAVRSSVEALTAALVDQAECRGVRAQLNQASTARWLRRRFQLSAREAGRLTSLAGVLPRWLGVQGALAAGRVGVESAAAIVTVLADLPSETSAADLTAAEELLLTQAGCLDPGELARCGQALAEALTVTPDVDDPAEAAAVAAEAAAAEAAEASRWDRRALRLVRRRDGMVGITGQLDPLDGALVWEVLEATARPTAAVDGIRDPRNPEQRMADALVEVVAASGPLDLDDDHPGTATPHPHPTDHADHADHDTADHDDLDPDDCDDLDDGDDADDCDGLDAWGLPGAQHPHPAHPARSVPTLDLGPRFDLDARLALDAPLDPDAVVANRADRRWQARRHRTTRRPTTARPTVTASIILNWDTLKAGLPGAGTLPDGTALSPAATLTALCDAAIIPMIFTGPGQPLHVGRAARAFTTAQRRALAARDRGCTWFGCHRRASRCAAHHLKHWEDGGETSIDNGALLCRYHHQLLHREGWTGHLDARGRPEYRPPAALDPHQRPRQHLRFATALVVV